MIVHEAQHVNLTGPTHAGGRLFNVNVRLNVECATNVSKLCKVQCEQSKS